MSSLIVDAGFIFVQTIRFSCAAVTAGLLLMSSSPASAAFWGASNELLHDDAPQNAADAGDEDISSSPAVTAAHEKRIMRLNLFDSFFCLYKYEPCVYNKRRHRKI
jgi:hypothetical protein